MEWHHKYDTEFCNLHFKKVTWMMIANGHEQRDLCAMRIMDVREGVGESWSEMHIDDSWPTGETCEPISRTCRTVFLEKKEKLEFWITRESVHKRRFGGARIAKDIAYRCLKKESCPLLGDSLNR